MPRGHGPIRGSTSMARTHWRREHATVEYATLPVEWALGSGNLIVITGTDRTDGTVSRPGQALVQDPVQILVTGPFRRLAG